MIKNYFKEMQEKGIKNIELSFKDLIKLKKEGRITQEQFLDVIIKENGLESVLESFEKSLKAGYGDMDFSKELPESLKRISKLF